MTTPPVILSVVQLLVNTKLLDEKVAVSRFLEWLSKLYELIVIDKALRWYATASGLPIMMS